VGQTRRWLTLSLNVFSNEKWKGKRRVISTIAGLSERLRCMEDFVTYTLDNGR
jgi:hypothetical protein